MEKKDAYQRKGKRMILSVVTFFIACFLIFGTTVPAATTISETSEQTHRFYPTQDTIIDQTTPEKNYTNATTLSVSNTFGNNSSGWERDILLYFNISMIPTYAQITTATVSLYYYGYEDTNPAYRVLSLHQITRPWDTKNVTWKTRPTAAQHNISYARIPATVGWMTWDVTTETQRMINNPTANLGWQLADKNPWQAYNIPLIKFKSKETQTTYYPYLEIQYTIPLIISTTGPDDGYTNTNIIMNGTILCGGTPPYTYHWEFGDGTPTSYRNTTHTYTTAGCYTITLSVQDSTGKTTSTTTAAIIKENTTEPYIKITQPQNGLYFGSKKIVSLPKPWILGPIDITVETYSKYPITKVKFLIDNEVQQIDTTAPYTWTWNQKTIPGKHTLKVIVVDASEASAVDQITVCKIL
ncbi:MAG: DNRLRE domain-containing protein [Thermoplasmata archaeon]|nr:DNRLRE domain-containing protein [Thermoplasmata archaeon]